MGSSSSEEAAELVATIRGEHVAMKKWFNENPSAEAETLRKKYGKYPSLWKEVLNWQGWKESRKAYLKQTSTSKVPEKGVEQNSGDPPKSRKRRSRWGNADSNDDSKRRSRWGKDEAATIPSLSSASSLTGSGVPGHYGPLGNSNSAVKPIPGLGLPGMPTNLTPEQQKEMQMLQARLREINEKIDNLESEAARVDALPRGHRERSPSPPPIYGVDGKRKNTRTVRWRQKYTTERQDVLEKLLNFNPANRQSMIFKRRRSKKIRIPVEAHPQYNFIGLIIGPRGKTQKELEAKTGCKIAIRGRGSVKEGARGRRDGKVTDSDDEPLHVVISGDDQRSVDAATDMIEQMLVVIDDEKNVHKQQQLRELALLNGTLKEDEYCSICGEKGHRPFECPKRFSMKKSTIQIRCAICGDTSHPTRDCTQKPNDRQENTKQVDSDYMSFMAELDGKKVENDTSNAPVTQATPQCTVAPPLSKLPPPAQQSAGFKSPGATQPSKNIVTNLPPPPPPPLNAIGVSSSNLPPPPPPARVPPSMTSANHGHRNFYGSRNNFAPHNQNHQYAGSNFHGSLSGGINQGNYHSQSNHGQTMQHQGFPGYNQQQQQEQHQPNGQQQQQQTWDYTQYYGQGQNQSAGGFNWWEN